MSPTVCCVSLMCVFVAVGILSPHYNHPCRAFTFSWVMQVTRLPVLNWFGFNLSVSGESISTRSGVCGCATSAFLSRHASVSICGPVGSRFHLLIVVGSHHSSLPPGCSFFFYLALRILPSIVSVRRSWSGQVVAREYIALLCATTCNLLQSCYRLTLRCTVHSSVPARHRPQGGLLLVRRDSLYHDRDRLLRRWCRVLACLPFRTGHMRVLRHGQCS